VDPARERFTLGEWIVDAAGNRLLRGDEQRPLRHKAMALLVLLARHAGETVSRDEIVNTIWDGNQFVAPKASTPPYGPYARPWATTPRHRAMWRRWPRRAIG